MDENFIYLFIGLLKKKKNKSIRFMGINICIFNVNFLTKFREKSHWIDFIVSLKNFEIKKEKNILNFQLYYKLIG